MIPSSCDAATTHAREKSFCQRAARDRFRSCEIDSAKLIHRCFIPRPLYRQEPVAPAPQGNATGSDNKLAARSLARAPRRKPMPHSARRDRSRPYDAVAQTSFARYAIFYTPQPGTALAVFGRSWFGRANDGVTLQAFSEAGLGAMGFARFAPVPRRYSGLHALIKAPFAPRAGIGLDAIKTRLIN